MNELDALIARLQSLPLSEKVEMLKPDPSTIA